MPFANRSDAGRRLAQALLAYRDEHPVILALPRGGVPVAAEIAKMLDAPLDLLLVRKIGAPFQPELAIGAVSDGEEPIIVRNDDVISVSGVQEAEFAAICQSELAEIERRRSRYLGDRPRAEVAGHTVIVVDDGVATGATTRAALQAVRRRHPKKVVLAVPVAPSDTMPMLRAEADDVVCLEAHRDFGAIGFFYRDFHQVSDQEVIDALRAHPAASAAAKSGGAAVRQN